MCTFIYVCGLSEKEIKRKNNWKYKNVFIIGKETLENNFGIIFGKKAPLLEQEYSSTSTTIPTTQMDVPPPQQGTMTERKKWEHLTDKNEKELI